MREFEKNIRKVEPYVPGEQPQKKVIKLNTNENPYPPAPGVLAAMKKLEGHVDSLRLYPDPTSDALVSALADFYHVGKDQVFVGVGSDDVLSMCFLTFFNSEKPVFFPDITYSFYKVWADLYRIPYECKKVDENFHIIKEDYYPENGGVIFPNPNAPTSIYGWNAYWICNRKSAPDQVFKRCKIFVQFLYYEQNFSGIRSRSGKR